LEERRALRRKPSETGRQLERLSRAQVHEGCHASCGRSVLRRSGSEESIQWKSRPSCASAPSLSFHPMPFRITQESYRPRVSDRTMGWRFAYPTCLQVSGAKRRRHDRHETPGKRTIRSGLAAKKRSRRSGQATRAGAGWARNSTASGRGGSMPLDIPFYRTFPQRRRLQVYE